MIFAWNDADPETGNGDWNYHGPNQRIQRVVMLLNFKDETLHDQLNLPSDTLTHEFRVQNVC